MMERGYLQEHGVTEQGGMASSQKNMFRLDIKKKFFTMKVVRALEQVGQSCAYSILGSILDQVGRGF